MSIDQTGSCCGVGEISGLSNAVRNGNGRIFVDELARDRYMYSNKYPFYFFADVRGDGGTRLYNYIKDAKLGRIVKTVPKINHNSDNKIEAYLWTINDRAFKKLCKSMGIDTTEDDDDEY